MDDRNSAVGRTHWASHHRWSRVDEGKKGRILLPGDDDDDDCDDEGVGGVGGSRPGHSSLMARTIFP